MHFLPQPPSLESVVASSIYPHRGCLVLPWWVCGRDFAGQVHRDIGTDGMDTQQPFPFSSHLLPWCQPHQLFCLIILYQASDAADGHFS